jgi:hypothetical protein
LREQQGGAGVTEVVKADVRPIFAERPPEQRLEGSAYSYARDHRVRISAP